MTPPRGPSGDLPVRTAALLIAVALVLGTAVRAGGLFTDFWLDEVWSWSIAKDLASPLQVFTGIHHSNNHHLLTLWMFWLGDAAPVWLYRLPSLLAGIASIPLAAALAWPRGRLEAVLAASGVAACFALVHFSSEARGYALAVAFALAAQLALRRALDRRSGPAAGLFGVCVGLGLLSHLGFAFYWAGALSWSLWRWRRGRIAAGWLVRLHALPIGVLALLYAVDLRLLVVGGGNPTDLANLAARCFGFAFGAPVVRSLALPYAALAAAGLAAAARARARRGDDSWIGDAVTIALAPALVFAAFQPEVIAVRYFLIGIALALLLLADWMAAGLRAGGWRRAVAAALGLAFLAGNAVHIVAFLEHGRGGYRAALRTMAEHSRGPEIRVASDHDFRNGTVLRFYARELPPGRRLVYFPRDRQPPGGPEWWILHRAQRPAHMPARIRDAAGNTYALFAEFDHAAISGFYWALYRNVRASTTVPKPRPEKGSAPNAATRR